MIEAKYIPNFAAIFKLIRVLHSRKRGSDAYRACPDSEANARFLACNRAKSLGHIAPDPGHLDGQSVIQQKHLLANPLVGTGKPRPLVGLPRFCEHPKCEAKWVLIRRTQHSHLWGMAHWCAYPRLSSLGHVAPDPGLLFCKKFPDRGRKRINAHPFNGNTGRNRMAKNQIA